MPGRQEVTKSSQRTNSPGVPARARLIAGIGLALFVVGLSLPAVNLAPWLPGLNVFLLSFLGVVTLGGGSAAHFFACLPGAAANVLMLLVLINTLAGRCLGLWMSWTALVLTLIVLAPLRAVIGANEAVVSTGYYCWVGCAGLSVAASLVARFQVRQSVPEATGYQSPTDAGSGDGGFNSLASTAHRPAINGGARARSVAFVSLVVGLSVFCATQRGELWMLLVSLAVLGAGAIPLKMLTRRKNRVAAAVCLFVMFAAWWPTGGALLQSVRERDMMRGRICLALGVDPDTARTVVPHAWYLGTPGRTTPLYLAIEAGEPEWVNLLLRNGANPNLVCGEPENNRSPLQHALANGNPDIIRLIEQAGGTQTPSSHEPIAGRARPPGGPPGQRPAPRSGPAQVHGP